MNQSIKQTTLKVVLGVFLITLFLDIQSFGLIMGNRGGAPYDEPIGKNQNIESYIIDGAGYFLGSNADFFLFLNKIEMSDLNGVDYNELRTILNRAIENMEKAKSIYTSLVQTASNTTYRQSFIDGLKAFDYTGYQKKCNLNGVMFKEVKAYLYKGNVTGVFARIHGRTGKILDSLYAVKKYIDADTFPVIPNLWRINQTYGETLLFGQYAAEVFSNIKY